MLVVETIVRIRREHASGKAIKAIARDLRLSRKVVRKAIRAPEGAFDYRRTVQPLPRLGPFQERLDTLLPTLMRRDKVQMWVLVAGEYNEDPVMATMLPATWLHARRRTILVFFDPGEGKPIEKLALAVAAHECWRAKA